MVWYSHLFQSFPQFIVIHTVKGFGIVNKAEIDVFLELSCFFKVYYIEILFQVVPRSLKIQEEAVLTKSKKVPENHLFLLY